MKGLNTRSDLGPWWEIEYKAGTNSLIIKVNPNDGQVVDENGNPLSSGGTANPNAATTATPTAAATPTATPISY